jgi:hypothetical protein
MSRAYTVAASVLTAFTLLLVYWCIRLPWASRVDFDIIGILWLMQNIPQLMLVSITFLFGLTATYCWKRALHL